jgi:hypothetical protein
LSEVPLRYRSERQIFWERNEIRPLLDVRVCIRVENYTFTQRDDLQELSEGRVTSQYVGYGGGLSSDYVTAQKLLAKGCHSQILLARSQHVSTASVIDLIWIARKENPTAVCAGNLNNA